MFTSEHIQGFQPWAAPCNSYLWELVLSLQRWVFDEWAATWIRWEICMSSNIRSRAFISKYFIHEYPPIFFLLQQALRKITQGRGIADSPSSSYSSKCCQKNNTRGGIEGLPSSCCCKPCYKKHKGRPTHQYFNVVRSEWRLSSFVRFRLHNWYQMWVWFRPGP
jgi:hypothetical protein